MNRAATNEPSLYRTRDFRLFWGGETVSAFGSQISTIALPLTAVLLLHARAFEMGVLLGASTLPYVIVSLPAGAWLDRRRRRPILLAANLAAGLTLLGVPTAYWTGVLSIGLLYLLALVVGSLTVLIGTAYQAFVPALASRTQAIDANTALEASRAGARTGGPALGGLLVTAVGAPVAVLFDAVSFLVAALSLVLLDTAESAPPRSTVRLTAEIREGVSKVVFDPLLRANAGSSAITNCSLAAIDAIFVLYLHSRLHASAFLIGLVLAIGNAGFLIGAALARPAARRFGSANAIVVANASTLAGTLLLPLIADPRALAIAVIMIGRGLIGIGETIYTINQLSQRQSMTPSRLLGRVNAAVRLVAGTGLTLGALAGGALATAAGMRTTLFVAVFGLLLSLAWVVAARAQRQALNAEVLESQ